MTLTEAKRRIVEHLRTADVAVVTEVAEEFGLTEAAVRQHLDALAEMGLVERCSLTRSGRGRPATGWRLTDQARTLFPDHHADLSVEVLRAVESALGAEALTAVLADRAAHQVRRYRALVGRSGSLSDRAGALATARTAEGYVAEVRPDGDAVLLIEHHCPIAEAAGSCAGLCDSELSVFRAVLGSHVRVERVQHLVSGDRRCAYRLRT